MRIYKRKSIVNRQIKLTLLCFSIPSFAWADFYLHSWEDHYQNEATSSLNLSTQYYSTSRNYSPNAPSLTSDGLQRFQRFQSDLTFSTGLTERLSLFGRLSWAYVDLHSDLVSGTGSGFTDQSVGLNYRLYKKPNRLILDAQLQIDFPLYNPKVSDDASHPSLGDGTVDVTPGLFATIPLYTGKNRLFLATLGTGITFRSIGFSTAIPFSALFQSAPLKEGFFVGAGSRGFISLQTDSNIVHPGYGTGGSFIAGTVNPSLVQLTGQIGYKAQSGATVSASALKSIWGQSAPESYSMLAQLQFPFGDFKKEDPLLLTPPEYGQANQGFVSYSLDSKVLRVNDRLNLVKIDKGSQDGIKVGQIFDIFSVNKDGSIGETVARGIVSNVKLDESALTITDYFKEAWIEEGFLAKRLIH